MKVIVAKSGGFCMGVSRAVDIAMQEASASDAPVYTMGPLIHNNQAVAYLERHGVHVATEPPKYGKVIIRAHGVVPQVFKDLEKNGLEVIDATCPHVIASQKIIDREYAEGRHIIIVGDERHPEVQGLRGHAPDSHTVVHEIKSVEDISPDLPVSVVAQTTFSYEGYKKITEKIVSWFADQRIFSTICDATEKRQGEVVSLCQTAQVLVVVGGRNSANTCRLAQIGRECGVKVCHVETSVELDVADFEDVDEVAVTAGASTPETVIDRVLMRLSDFSGEVVSE